MILSTPEEIAKTNKFISQAVNEIVHKGFTVTEKSLGSLEDDISTMMRALQSKNKIYDFAVIIDWNGMISKFVGRIAYSLIDTSKIEEKDKFKYEELIEFKF